MQGKYYPHFREWRNRFCEFKWLAQGNTGGLQFMDIILSWEDANCSACLPRPLRLNWDCVCKNISFKWQSTIRIFLYVYPFLLEVSSNEHISMLQLIRSITPNKILGLRWSQSPRLTDYYTGSVSMPLLKHLSIYSTISSFTQCRWGS